MASLQPSYFPTLKGLRSAAWSEGTTFSPPSSLPGGKVGKTEGPRFQRSEVGKVGKSEGGRTVRWCDGMKVGKSLSRNTTISEGRKVPLPESPKVGKSAGPTVAPGEAGRVAGLNLVPVGKGGYVGYFRPSKITVFLQGP